MPAVAVKALTFDIIGTAFDWFDSLSEGASPLMGKYGLSIEPGAFATGAANGYAEGVAAVNAHSKPWTPPDEILRESISALLSVGDTPSAEQVNEFFALWRALRPV